MNDETTQREVLSTYDLRLRSLDLESKAATAVNASFRQQNKEPFGSLPDPITTELAPDDIDIDGAA